MRISFKPRAANISVLLIGLASVLPWSVSAQKRPIKPEFVDYCALVRTPEAHIGKLVRTKALMTYSTVARVDGGDSFLYSSKCNYPDAFTTMYRSEETEHQSTLSTTTAGDDFLAGLAKDKNYILEVEITGKFERSLIPRFGHLGWSINNLDRSTIVSIRDVMADRAYKQPNNSGPSPKINTGTQLRSLVIFQMIYLMGGKEEGVQSIDKNFVLVDPSGAEFRSGRLDELRARGLFDRSIEGYGTFVSGPEVTINKGRYIAGGTIGLRLGLEKVAELKYQSIYRKTRDGFILEKVKFEK